MTPSDDATAKRRSRDFVFNCGYFIIVAGDGRTRDLEKSSSFSGRELSCQSRVQ